MHQKSVFLSRQQLPRQKSIWCNYFGTLKSTEVLKPPQEGLDGELQLILVISAFGIVAITHSSPQPCGRHLCIGSWSSLYTECGSKGAGNWPSPPNIRDLCSTL